MGEEIQSANYMRWWSWWESWWWSWWRWWWQSFYIKSFIISFIASFHMIYINIKMIPAIILGSPFWLYKSYKYNQQTRKHHVCRYNFFGHQISDLQHHFEPTEMALTIQIGPNNIPSLKLTASLPLKIDGTGRRISFLFGANLFSGANLLLVLGSLPSREQKISPPFWYVWVDDFQKTFPDLVGYVFSLLMVRVTMEATPTEQWKKTKTLAIFTVYRVNNSQYIYPIIY